MFDNNHSDEAIQQANKDTAELENLFNGLQEEAAQFDNGLVALESEVKQMRSSFNMKRTTLRTDGVGVTYMQGLPERDLAEVWASGSKIPIDQVLESLVSSEVIRFKAAKGQIQITDYQLIAYRSAVSKGLYGKSFLTALEEAGIKPIELYKKHDTIARDSFTGKLFVNGLVQYKSEVLGLISQVARMSETKEVSAFDLLYPKSALQKAGDELAGWAESQGLEIHEL